MTIPLNADVLRAAYDFLCVTPPFCRWNLPSGEDVEFRVIKDAATAGWFNVIAGRNVIALSQANIGHTGTMLRVLAHEMLHLHQTRTGMASVRRPHNAAFHKLAAGICRLHGFDPLDF